MVKANELRIGNYVFFNSKIRKINGIGVDDDKQYIYEAVTFEDGKKSLTCMEFNLEPIPLTEELLLKFGFEKIGIAFIKNEYIIREQSESEWSVDIEPINMLYHTISTIKYVHQLQNLYFALTGEELQINM